MVTQEGGSLLYVSMAVPVSMADAEVRGGGGCLVQNFCQRRL